MQIRAEINTDHNDRLINPVPNLHRFINLLLILLMLLILLILLIHQALYIVH